MTVAETLSLHAALQMGGKQPKAVLEARQEEVLGAMGLMKQRNTMVHIVLGTQKLLLSYTWLGVLPMP